MTSRRSLLDVPSTQEIQDAKEPPKPKSKKKAGNLEDMVNAAAAAPTPFPNGNGPAASSAEGEEKKEDAFRTIARRRASFAENSDGSGGGLGSGGGGGGGGGGSGGPLTPTLKGSFSLKIKKGGKQRRLSIGTNDDKGTGSGPQSTAVAGTPIPPKLSRSRRFSTAVSAMIEANQKSKQGSLERADSRRNLLKLTKPLVIKEIVRFGDIASFADLDVGGLLCGNSRLFNTLFVDAQIRFEASNSIHKQEEACFVIHQKFQYSAMKSFDKLLSLSGVPGATISNWMHKIPTSNPCYKGLKNLKANINSEQDTNELESKRMLGEPVAYGSIVQLRHKISGKFLTQTKNRAEQDVSAMEIALMDGGMEGSWWKVGPTHFLVQSFFLHSFLAPVTRWMRFRVGSAHAMSFEKRRF
jgi:hypothetical protein